MPEETKFIDQCQKEGIKSLITFEDERKEFIAEHILGDYEMKVYFAMFPNNFIVGMNTFMQRIYVGKIGERHDNYADLCLFYLDIGDFPKEYDDFSEVQFKKVISFQDKMYFYENDYPIFFDAFGKDKWWGIHLPKSDGSLYEEVKETRDGSNVSQSLIPYLYAAIGDSFAVDPSFYIILKTIEKCCQEESRAYSDIELARIYSELNTAMDVQPYPSSFIR